MIANYLVFITEIEFLLNCKVNFDTFCSEEEI